MIKHMLFMSEEFVGNFIFKRIRNNFFEHKYC